MMSISRCSAARVFRRSAAACCTGRATAQIAPDGERVAKCRGLHDSNVSKVAPASESPMPPVSTVAPALTTELKHKLLLTMLESRHGDLREENLNRQGKG